MNYATLAVRFILFAVALLAVLALIGSDPRAGQLAITTLTLASLIVSIALPVGTLLAVLITRTSLPGRRCVLLLLGILLFLPLYVQASAWDAGFGQQGWCAQWLGNTAQPWLFGMRAAVWIHSLAALPWVTLIVGLSLEQVDADIEEQALVDVGALQTLLWVTLPLALPGIVAAALFVAVTTAAEMTVTDLYRVRTYAEELYTNLALTADASDAALALWPQLALVTLLCVFALMATKSLVPSGDRTAQRHSVEFALGAWRWPLAILTVGTLLLIVSVPLANLFYKAGFTVDTSSGTPQRTWRAETLRLSTLPASVDPRQWECGHEYLTTTSLGALVGTLSLLMGVPLAWLACRGSLAAWPALVLIVLGLALPGPLIGLGTIVLFNQPDSAWLAWLYDRTIVPAALAITMRTLPLAILVLWYSFRSIGRDQIESALVDGAGYGTILLKIVIPQRLPALAIAWLGSFAMAAGDLSSSILVLPPGMLTIANHIFLLIHAGVHNEEAGLCLTQVAMFVAIAAVVFGLARVASAKTIPSPHAEG